MKQQQLSWFHSHHLYDPEVSIFFICFSVLICIFLATKKWGRLLLTFCLTTYYPVSKPNPTTFICRITFPYALTLSIIAEYIGWHQHEVKRVSGLHDYHDTMLYRSGGVFSIWRRITKEVCSELTVELSLPYILLYRNLRSVVHVLAVQWIHLKNRIIKTKAESSLQGLAVNRHLVMIVLPMNA